MAEMDPETIQRQQDLLAQHRRTLAHLLHQAAQFSAGHLPAHVANGIDDARAEISRTKTVLRTASVAVSDDPNDIDPIPRVSSLDARDAYLGWVIERNLYLDPRGTYQTQRQVQLKLDEIYVSLRAQQDTPEVDRRLLEQELAEIEKLVSIAISAEDAEDRRDQLFGVAPRRYRGAAPPMPIVPIELSEAVTRHDKLVILGDPGAGKSTLLRYLVLKHAEALRNGHPNAGDGLGPACFPIFIRIADYAESGAWRTRSLSDFFTDYYSRHECPGAGLHDLLETMLAAGNCLIMLDGLDEVVGADERRGVVQQIESFVRRYDDKPNHFVITSRIAGYRSAPLSEPFVHCTIQDMDDVQINRFLERWCTAVEAAQTPDLSPEARAVTARREINAILRAVHDNSGVRRLATNPLLLRTLALIHRTGASLPQKRIELYKLAADTLARTWRPAQGIAETVLVKDEYLTPLLSKLAYWLHANKPTGIATEHEVYKVLGEEWARINSLSWDPDNPSPAITQEVKNFLLKVREHTGLFVERAPRRYGFMHLTFEEYYAARYLVARPRASAKQIRAHLHDPRWDEPILLAIGFVGLEFPEEVTTLLELAILAAGEEAGPPDFVPSRHEALLGRDYLFALRCLGDQIPVRLGLMRRLVDRLANELLYLAGSGRFQRYRQTLEQRINNLRGSDAAALLIPYCFQALQDTDWEVRYQAMEVLGKVGAAGPEVLAVLRKALQDTDREVRYQAMEVLGKVGAAGPEVLAVLRHALQHTDPDVRILAVLALGSLGMAGPEALATLHQTYQHADSDVRYRVVLTLRKLRAIGPGALAVLRLALDDDDQRVRYLAMRALENLEVAEPEVLAVLHLALQHADVGVRIQAVEALGKLGAVQPKALAVLHLAFQDAHLFVRLRVMEVLGRLEVAQPEALAVLRLALRHADEFMCLRAVDVLRKMGMVGPEALVVLHRALRHPNMFVRLRAVDVLRKMGMVGPEALVVLRRALRHPNMFVRLEAVDVLRKIGMAGPESLVVLRQALQHPNRDVRIEAVSVLGRLGAAGPEALAALRKALQHADVDVRLQAVEALGNLGAAGPELLTALREALQHAEKQSARDNAAYLTGRIGVPDDATIEALYAGLLNYDYHFRTACTTALAQLGQRFPEAASGIEQKLLHAIEDPAFASEDQIDYRTGHDYAFDGLWMLVTNEGAAK